MFDGERVGVADFALLGLDGIDDEMGDHSDHFDTLIPPSETANAGALHGPNSRVHFVYLQ